MSDLIDLSGAGVLVLVTLGFTQLVKGTFPTLPSRLVPIVVLLTGLAATIVTANSDWGDTQRVGDKVLSELNFWSLVIVAIAVGAVSATIYTGLKTIANIGQNKDGAI